MSRSDHTGIRYGKRFTRLVGIVAAGAALMTGTVVGVVFVGDNLIHKTASASEIALPPLSSENEEGSTVYADDGTTVLAVLKGSELRQPVVLSQVSKTLITAVLDTEDHRFYLHGGFDVYSTVRALSVDSAGDGGIQGGSTIAQQLVKQLYLTPARTLSRKVKEAVIADRLERQYTKNQILQAYLNTIYLGESAYGIQAAAERYFGIPASKLDVPQSALLAGMIQDPNGENPILDPAAARDRRTEVLGRMLYYHDITEAQYKAANATPLPTLATTPTTETLETTDPVADYYVNEVRDELLADGSPLGSTYDERFQSLFEGGLKIYTNFDPAEQADAEQAIATEAPNTGGEFQEAMVSIDPTNGAVRALVGGTGGPSNQFDIITQGTRQPGSGFKVFTLLTALQQGYSVYDTVDGAGPCSILFPGETKATPIRNDDAGEGVQTIVQATANSVNCAFIRLAHEVGLPNIIAMAHSLGISETIPEYPSIVIGATAVHPIEMAAAYAAVADGGMYHTPSFIDHIVDRAGDTIYQGDSPGKRIVSPQIAAEATIALQAVVQYGTGTAAALYNRPVAGKTGTTNDDVDAWFNGFTPQLEATVWMGNEAAEVPMLYGSYGLNIAVFGATYPAPTWRAFAAAALANQPVENFPAVDYALLPPTKYITSESLVHDDVSQHNAGGVYCPPGYTAGNQFNGTYYCYPATTTPTTTPGVSPVTLPDGGAGGVPPTIPGTTATTTGVSTGPGNGNGTGPGNGNGNGRGQ